MSTAVAETLVPIAARDFNLDLTLQSGQVFHWRPHMSGWLGAVEDNAVYLEQHAAALLVPPGMAAMLERYFALDHPLETIAASFPPDPAMADARDFCRGMRIIRQPRWECLATFITSSMKQVVHIAQMSHAIRRRFGRRIEWHGVPLFTYPTAEELARASEETLRACSLGYRAKNLLATARMIAGGEVDLSTLDERSDDEIRAELCRLPGVGEKVANCVLLFGFGRLRAFPIDVWIARVLREKFFRRKRRVTTKHLREFSQRYFGQFGGYAQQYLFHHARTATKRSNRAPKRRSPAKVARDDR